MKHNDKTKLEFLLIRCSHYYPTARIKWIDPTIDYSGSHSLRMIGLLDGKQVLAKWLLICSIRVSNTV